MTTEQINKLLLQGKFPGSDSHPELVETHISWVILGENYVYKIKKPIHYSFLDFSTPDKRQYYCEREVALNKRLTADIYLDVQPVRQSDGCLTIEAKAGEVIDYAVRMRKVAKDRQMDVLLQEDKVTPADIRNLAEVIASFHRKTDIIHNKDSMDIRDKFNDLGQEEEYVQEQLGNKCSNIISLAIHASDLFMEKHRAQLACRLRDGYFRDCHGDLHSRNIFLLPAPQPFDCIEFNDDYRYIDVLNEVAFLCMDLDALCKKELSDLFLTSYNNLFPAMKTAEDRQLFLYYKSYRANIRAKVNSLRSRDAQDAVQKRAALDETEKYLHLMDAYLKQIQL